ncbi:MAG TPA: hypothetical protein VFY93_16615 [Planctomycetota bacterium]|nr:hypothetical protein [Planctomycetota bacterium]
MRRHRSPLFTIALLATGLLSACNNNEGGEGALDASFSRETEGGSVPLAQDHLLSVCCDAEGPVVARLLVGEVAVLDRDGDVIPDITFPSQFEIPPPGPGARFLGFSLKDVDPPGALSFRWDGPFVADLHRDANESGSLLPFDPDVDVGEPFGYLGDGVHNVLEVSAARCDFEHATFTMVVFEFSYLGNPTQGAGILVYRTQEQVLEITNTCYTPLPPPPGAPIVFSNRPDGGGDREVWVIDADGGNLGQLTDNTFEDDDPAWSPDRSKIAFISFRDSGTRSDLFLMSPDGTQQEKKADFAALATSAREPAWSPGGDRIAVAADNGFVSDIWIVDLTTDPATLHQLTSQPADPLQHNYDSSPTWSESGTEVLFVRNGWIYSVPAAGGAPSLSLSPADPDDSISAIDSGPAGVVLANYFFAETHIRLAWWGGGLGIAQVTAGGTHLADEWPSWSPASDRVVFARQDGEAGRRLYTVPVDGTSPHDAAEIPNQPAGSNERPDWGFGPRP